jgi:hypothetical protein
VPPTGTATDAPIGRVREDFLGALEPGLTAEQVEDAWNLQTYPDVDRAIKSGIGHSAAAASRAAVMSNGAKHRQHAAKGRTAAADAAMRQIHVTLTSRMRRAWFAVSGSVRRNW